MNCFTPAAVYSVVALLNTGLTMTRSVSLFDHDEVRAELRLHMARLALCLKESEDVVVRRFCALPAHATFRSCSTSPSASNPGTNRHIVDLVQLQWTSSIRPTRGPWSVWNPCQKVRGRMVSKLGLASPSGPYNTSRRLAWIHAHRNCGVPCLLERSENRGVCPRMARLLCVPVSASKKVF